MAEDKKDLTDKVGSAIEEAKQFANLGTSIAESIKQIYNLAGEVNNTFGQMRERISEISQSIALATPELNKMGGTADDAQKAIKAIAEATKKNVVATTENIKEIFATSKVVGLDMKTIVDYATDAGVSFGNIQENLEGGVNYVQSIGMNVSEIMQSVVYNMDKLNRFNFEGGAMGLTKMAAQAAMLRVDMSVAANFADQVLDPEGAIKMASAFQRLGVNVGGLADPFALMNMSINDPAGLQKSLAEMSKQFTYFDEKTKSFRINPEGIRMMREISKETGISYENLSKMGLAAANSDMIMSQMKFGGNLTEEQKMYISSLAQLSGDTGEYVIKVKDEQGKEVFKKLTELSEEQLKQAIKTDQEKPKSMEDIARAQLDEFQQAGGDIAAIRNRIVGGVTGSEVLSRLPQQIGNLEKAFTTTLEKKSFSAEDVKSFTDNVFKVSSDTFQKLMKGEMSPKEAVSSLIDKMKEDSNMSEMIKKTKDLPGEILSGMMSQLKESSPDAYEYWSSMTKTDGTRTATTKGFKAIGEDPTTQTKTIKEIKEVIHKGDFNYTIDVKGTDFIDTIKKIFQKMLDSSEFQQFIVKTAGGTPDATGQTMKTGK